MSIITMVGLEILRRKRSFFLAMLAVAIAVATMLAVHGSLKVYDVRSAQMLAVKQTELKQRLKQLQDEMRKATLKLSFNLAILPAAQDLSDWHAKDYATATMPENYVNKMAHSKLLAVHHFLPTLTRKTKWPEMNRTVILVGCRGEVPNVAKKPRNPLVQPVPDGSMVIGYELSRSLNLQVGQAVRFMGREFKIARCQSQRGSKEDIGVWIPLKDAQELLDLPGRINSILALECICVGDSAIERIRAEIAKYLPDTQVVELGTKVVARGEARAKVKQEAVDSMERAKQIEVQLQSERHQLAARIVPGVIAACGIWIFLAALLNARRRRPEIAILRALGFRATHILALLILRSLAGGILGSLLGIATGLAAAWLLRTDLAIPLVGPEGIVTVQLIAGAATIGSLLGVVAGWIPALIASQQDPANILKEA